MAPTTEATTLTAAKNQSLFQEKASAQALVSGGKAVKATAVASALGEMFHGFRCVAANFSRVVTRNVVFSS
jgi:hypothetical protein